MKKISLLLFILASCSNIRNDVQFEANYDNVDSVLNESVNKSNNILKMSDSTTNMISNKIDKTAKTITNLKEEVKELKNENEALKSVISDNDNVGAPMTGVSFSLRWTRNLAHNLLKDIQVTFNDLNMDVKKDNYYLDFWTAFTVPASKRVGYDSMIGNVDELINPCDSSLAVGPAPNVTFIPSYILNLPLPLPFTRDTGIALPTAALPYNEMKIELQIRPITDLLIVDAPTDPTGTFNGGSSGGNSYGVSYPANSSDVADLNTKTLNIICFGEYALVSNQERVRMGSCPRDILIEQSQEVCLWCAKDDVPR